MNLKISIIGLLFLCPGLFTGAQPVKTYGQLKVEGTRLVDKNGKPVVLRGMSFGWHNWWPRFYNAGTVKWLHDDWKCSVVRAAMGVEPDGGYIKDSAGSVDCGGGSVSSVGCSVGSAGSTDCG